VILVVAATGCFWRREKAPVENKPAAFTVKPISGNTNAVITPTGSAVGRVASVNVQAKFAVLNFPVGQVPSNDTRFSIFHAGMKTGEIKITGPAQDSFTVGDIVSGSALEGDEVRGE